MFGAQTTEGIFLRFRNFPSNYSSLSFLWAPLALQGSPGKRARGAGETDAASSLTTPN